MHVTTVESRFYRRFSRPALAGRGREVESGNKQRSFDDYLVEAFQGEVIKDGPRYSRSISPLARQNLVRLSNQRH